MSRGQVVALLVAVAIVAYIGASLGANQRSEPDQVKTQRPYDDVALKMMEQLANRGPNASFIPEERRRVETAARQVMGLQPAYIAQFPTSTLAAMVLQTMKNRNAVYDAANPAPRAAPYTRPYVAPYSAPSNPRNLVQTSVDAGRPNTLQPSWLEQHEQERKVQDQEQRLSELEQQVCAARGGSYHASICLP